MNVTKATHEEAMTEQEQAIADLAASIHTMVQDRPISEVIPAMTMCLSYLIHISNISPDGVIACLKHSNDMVTQQIFH